MAKIRGPKLSKLEEDMAKIIDDATQKAGGLATSTYSMEEGPDKKMTMDLLEQCKQLIGNRKFIVIHFSPWIEDDACFGGKFINEILHCKENEEVFIIPWSHKGEFLKYRNAFREI